MSDTLRHLSVGFVVVIILAAGACDGRPSGKQSGSETATGTSNTEASTSSGDEDVYLAPFLPGVGVPIAFCQEEWRDTWHAGLYSHELGVPFEGQDANAPSGAESFRPLPPNVAIWSDGTVIWSELPGFEDVTCYERKVDPNVVRRLIESVRGGRYNKHDNMKFSQQILHDELRMFSLIAILDGADSFVLRCQMDQMERINEYWYEDSAHDLITFPFDKYSFDTFSEHVPESYSQYLLDYLTLRAQLRAIIPKEGNVVDPYKRLRWVVLAKKDRVSTPEKTGD